MKYLVFNFAGIDFRVDADINEEGELETIWSVGAWNPKKREYEPILCDLEQFQKDLADKINEAVEDYNLSKRLFLEDLAYETKREGRL